MKLEISISWFTRRQGYESVFCVNDMRNIEYEGLEYFSSDLNDMWLLCIYFGRYEGVFISHIWKLAVYSRWESSIKTSRSTSTWTGQPLQVTVTQRSYCQKLNGSISNQPVDRYTKRSKTDRPLHQPVEFLNLSTWSGCFKNMILTNLKYPILNTNFP